MADEPALAPDAKIGEKFSQYEPWSCEICRHTFELRAAWFEPSVGIVCPKCKSKFIGPIGTTQ